MKNEKIRDTKTGLDLTTITNKLYVPEEVKYAAEREVYEKIAKEALELYNDKISNWKYIPSSTYVVIKPYAKSPYIKPTTDSGLLLVKDVKYNEKSGNTEAMDDERFLMVGEVIDAGPECKIAKTGMDAIFIKYVERTLPISSNENGEEEWATIPEQNIVGFFERIKPIE